MNAAAPLRIAVAGAGAMGAKHARALKALPGVVLAGIADPLRERAQALAAECGCRAFGALDELSGAIDAAVIATPTGTHAALAVPLLRGGVPCLVEKPLAAREADGVSLVDAAAAGGAALLAGHIERFNPAVESLFAQGIDPGSILALSARRMNPGSARVTDVDVVLDLMIHDLDVILALKQAAVTQVAAAGTRDHAEARLTFGDGATAALAASRAVETRVRELDVTTAAGTLRVDYAGRRLTLADGTPQTVAGDALQAELSHFAACAAGKTAPRISGQDALDVLRVAWRIRAAMGL